MRFALLVAAGIALAIMGIPVAHADTTCAPRVVAGPDTSCEFAMLVYNTVMGGAGTSFSVYSPVTGQTYPMHCMVEQHGATTCRSLTSDASVIMS